LGHLEHVRGQLRYLELVGLLEHVRGQLGYLGLVGASRTYKRTVGVPRTSWDI
jgi:hypothetical protein